MNLTREIKPDSSVLISSLVLAILAVEALRPGAKADAQARGAPGSATQPALSVTIHCDATTLKSGDEIPITFEITNNGNTPYQHRGDPDFSPMDACRLTATDENGEKVADPRANWLGGAWSGVVRGGAIQPGAVFTEVIALNRWALLTKPGTYRVTGSYYPDATGVPGGRSLTGILSQPITIVVQPRTDSEMNDYIKELSTQLPGASSTQDEQLLQKLMYTHDARVAPILISDLYQIKHARAEYWVNEAFRYYLPKNDKSTAALVDNVRHHGMVNGTFLLLKAGGCSREQILPLIALSLSTDHPDCWNEAALAAQTYADDSFTPRLIDIAMSADLTAKFTAIYALAMNRTDESVAALKKLLADQTVPPRMSISISEQTARAIRIAYTSRGYSDGRKLRPDDFPPEYQTMSLGISRP